jgi:hypothetical protein
MSGWLGFCIETIYRIRRDGFWNVATAEARQRTFRTWIAHLIKMFMD